MKSATILFLGSLFFAIAHNCSAATLPQKRILILFPYENNVPGFIKFEAGIRSALKASKDYQFEFYTKSDGLGMGLSISRTILHAHGGAIWAENNKEGGATFFLTLPLNNGEQP